ncbi:MAG TPA: carbohydrate kinase family protein [Bryobacteraceae bacterium]|jgi:sugar/nucleoside kinase (ribokinase family)
MVICDPIDRFTSGCRGVLCSGSIIYDILVRPVDRMAWGTTKFVDSIEYHIGGNAANTSRALAILGVSTRLLGFVGRDQQGDLVVEGLRRAGVDTAAIYRGDLATATTVVLVNEAGDRQFLHRLGISQTAFASPVRFDAPLIEGAAHYHLASLFLLPRLRVHAPSMLAKARSVGLRTSLDTNWDAEGRWILDLQPCLPYLDFLFMNEDEARMLTGSSDPSVAAGVVRAGGVRTTVIKLGRRGCAIYTDDREIVCPAFEVNVKDTTGAGDCFVAGFLSALLRNEDLATAGRFANAVGALSVQKIGAVTGVLSRCEVEDWMHSAR